MSEPAATSPERLHAGRLLLAGLLAALLVVAALSLLLGRYPEGGLTSWQRIAGDELMRHVIVNLRMPRVVAAILLGMSLAGAGAVFQLVFANPLVEPGFLGVSQGAATGAAFAIVFLGGSAPVVQGAAALAALAGLALSYLLARHIRYGGWVLRFVLAGIAVSALFSAGLGVLKYRADPLKQLPEIVFWLLGGLANVTWPRLLPVLPAVLVGLPVMLLFRWRVNVLALDEASAFSLGAAPGRERALLVVAAVLPTAALISLAGIVGWVGLMVPHVARRLFGASARHSLPAAMLLGAITVVLCDDLARTFSVGEIPLGILTSLLGAVVFAGLMVAPSAGVRR